MDAVNNTKSAANRLFTWRVIKGCRFRHRHSPPTEHHRRQSHPGRITWELFVGGVSGMGAVRQKYAERVVLSRAVADCGFHNRT